MLAEIYLLKLEAAVRAAKEAATTAPTSRFVPVTLPAAEAPAFHRALSLEMGPPHPQAERSVHLHQLAHGHAYSSHPGLLRRAAIGHAAAPPRSVMNARRLMAPP